jgi:hypothetical protein
MLNQREPVVRLDRRYGLATCMDECKQHEPMTIGFVPAQTVKT